VLAFRILVTWSSVTETWVSCMGMLPPDGMAGPDCTVSSSRNMSPTTPFGRMMARVPCPSGA
jgi:hypothetical protein